MESGEQEYKSMYVINLDRQRIIIVAGVIMMLCAGSFFLGARLGVSDRIKADTEKDAESLVLDEIVKSKQKSSFDPQIAREMQQYKQEILSPVKKRENIETKDKPLVENNEALTIPVSDDPFIKGPPKSKKTVKTSKNRSFTKKKALKGTYTIQIAAFAKERDANRLRKKLKTEGISSYLTKDNRFFYVRSGKSKNRDALKKRLQKITAKTQLKPILIKKG